MPVQRDTSLRYPGGRRTSWGVLAYLVGYVTIFLTGGRSIESALTATTVPTTGEPITLATLFEGTAIPAWVGSGWLFYNAHFVSITVPRPDQRPIARNLVMSADGLLLFLLVVPAGLLLAAGFLVVRDVTDVIELRFDFGTGRGRYAVNAGLICCFGYLPPAILGAVVFSATVAGVAVAPDLFAAIVLAGIGYPLVFGGIGGYVAARRS